MYQYYLKVVPTSYKAKGKVTESMQYSATGVPRMLLSPILG